jgi:hypothetical protein
MTISRTAGALARGVALAAALGTAPGCLSKNVPEPTRYFEPPPPAQPEKREPAAPPAEDGTHVPLVLRLRRVTGASHLKGPMVRRVSPVELGVDELERWTEMPATYIEWALERELFEARGLERAEGGAGPRLDVDVRAFEATAAPERSARVAFEVALYDKREIAILVRAYEATSPLPRDDPTDFARAIAVARDEAVQAAARDIVAALNGRS